MSRGCMVVSRTILSDEYTTSKMHTFKDLKKPFGLDLGINRDYTLKEDFKAFLSSDRYIYTYYVMALLTFNYEYFLEQSNLSIGAEYCKEKLFFSLRNKRLLKDSDYDKRLSEAIEDDNIVFPYISVSEDTSEAIRKCIRDGGNILIIPITYLPNSVVSTSHIALIILNHKTKIGYYYDSSFSYDELESSTFSETLTIAFQEFLDPEYTIVIKEQSCDAYIQGDFATCSAWSVYIIILSIMNPELNEYDIIQILQNLTLRERNCIIALFYYYAFRIIGNDKFYTRHRSSSEFSVIYEKLHTSHLERDLLPRLKDFNKKTVLKKLIQNA